MNAPMTTMLAAAGVLPVLLLILAAVPVTLWLLGLRYIPHSHVGIVEKFWSLSGSLQKGRIVAARGEAGFQAALLRGGLHFFYFPWQYRIHRAPLVSVAEGKIGYVYARDGQPLPPTQTLGATAECNNFQDAEAFLAAGGQRGRQRRILREGVYAVNQALFVVIAEDRVYTGPIREPGAMYGQWREQLATVGGFDPVTIGRTPHADAVQAPDRRGPVEITPAPARAAEDSVGVVTTHDGQPIPSTEVIAPEVRPGAGQSDHNCFQDIEAFLAAGGRRGKQLQVLTDGTFFINRWFATVELRPKTVIPIGYVGVVVSYYGVEGVDLTGDQFRYGEQVERGHRGVWKMPLPPGKYPLNPYAMKVELVPTVNFVLRWITGQTEEHQYDKDLTSIALITADGFEPTLPLSLVLHIDYEKAPRVVQRFGDVKRLISQTLDPIISAYFRDVAQSTHMLDLLTKREEIQRRATEELGRRFRDYDINCVAVLIGRPESTAGAGPDPIEGLFDQLRQRRLAREQVETFQRQEEAARTLRELNEAQAVAQKQTELTQTKVNIEIAGNRGQAELAEARQLADRDVARAQGEGRAKELLGRGEASRIAQTGLAEAAVLLKMVRAYSSPQLYALNRLGEQLSASRQPLVPQRVLLMGGAGGDKGGVNSVSLLGQFITMLMADKAGLNPGAPDPEMAEAEKFAETLAAEAGKPKDHSAA